jgi:hypothetical protein
MSKVFEEVNENSGEMKGLGSENGAMAWDSAATKKLTMMIYFK